VQPGPRFDDVLRDELRVVAARREQLDVERGDLASTGPAQAEAAASAAWHARLLGVAFSGGGMANKEIAFYVSGPDLTKLADYSRRLTDALGKVRMDMLPNSL